MIHFVVYNVGTLLIPRCKDLNFIRKHSLWHKIIALICLFFLLIFKKSLQIDLLFPSFSTSFQTMAHPRASLSYSCCYLQENISQASPPGITLETAEQLYAVSRGEWDALQGNEKGIALLRSALSLLFIAGKGTQVDVCWCGLTLAAASPDSTAPSGVCSAGWARPGAQPSLPRPGMLFPRPALILLMEACRACLSTSLLLLQGGVFALRQNFLHRGGSPWLLQQRSSDYKESHRAKINHIFHWLKSLWKGMASEPANIRLVMDKMVLHVFSFSWKVFTR